MFSPKSCKLYNPNKKISSVEAGEFARLFLFTSGMLTIYNELVQRNCENFINCEAYLEIIANNDYNKNTGG